MWTRRQEKTGLDRNGTVPASQWCCPLRGFNAIIRRNTLWATPELYGENHKERVIQLQAANSPWVPCPDPRPRSPVS